MVLIELLDGLRRA